jgi:nitroreductase
MLIDLLQQNRSFRRFVQSEKISRETLSKWIDNSRYCASARNAQPLKYVIACSPEKNEAVFDTLSWAGYLKNWQGPEEGERPAAYIVMLNDETIASNFHCDHGIAAQTILLSACEDGFGGCIVAAVDRKALRQILNLPVHLDIIQVIALGKPNETVVLEEIPQTPEFKYWRTDDQVHHVPKRPLTDLIVDIV